MLSYKFFHILMNIQYYLEVLENRDKLLDVNHTYI